MQNSWMPPSSKMMQIIIGKPVTGSPQISVFNEEKQKQRQRDHAKQHARDARHGQRGPWKSR